MVGASREWQREKKEQASLQATRPVCAAVQKTRALLRGPTDVAT